MNPNNDGINQWNVVVSCSRLRHKASPASPRIYNERFKFHGILFPRLIMKQSGSTSKNLGSCLSTPEHSRLVLPTTIRFYDIKVKIFHFSTLRVTNWTTCKVQSDDNAFSGTVTPLFKKMALSRWQLMSMPFSTSCGIILLCNCMFSPTMMIRLYNTYPKCNGWWQSDEGGSYLLVF